MTLRTTQKETTKRGVLSQLASIYDLLGLASPTSLIAKQLYRDICDNKAPWDTQLPESLLKRWRDWNSTLREDFVVPRAFTPYHQPISQLTLHAFGDASVNGVCAAVYAVVHQGEIVTQQLVCAKSRLAKKNLTIPRLELIAGHMSINLVTNVQAALTIHPSTIHCWLDSTVALYWIKGQGEYKQFVANRVDKIQQHKQVTWHHVPTEENQADIGSRGGNAENNVLWKQGPTWLSDPSNWPPDVITYPTTEVMAEAKVKREVFAVSQSTHDAFDNLLDRHPSPRALCISAWIQRFRKNCKSKREYRTTGPISTKEIESQNLWWVK